MSIENATLCRHRARRGRRMRVKLWFHAVRGMQVQLRFLLCVCNPLRTSCVSKLRNAGKLAFFYVRGATLRWMGRAKGKATGKGKGDRKSKALGLGRWKLGVHELTFQLVAVTLGFAFSVQSSFCGLARSSMVGWGNACVIFFLARCAMSGTWPCPSLSNFPRELGFLQAPVSK